MGFSTPKTPFNLSEFLSQKGTPRNSRKPNWKRAPQAVQPEAEESEETEATEASESSEAQADSAE